MPKEDSIVPIGADHPQALHALTRKHAEISGKIGTARLTLEQLTTDLEHIDAAIRIFDPTIETGRIRAKTFAVCAHAYRGEVTGIVLDSLREAAGPLTPREITHCLMSRRGLAADDRELFNLMLKRIRACLRAQRQQGVVRATVLDGPTQGWEAI